MIPLGSDAVQPDIIEKLPVQQRKRQEAIFELIQTEKSYVHSLNLVKEVGGINMVFNVGVVCLLGFLYSNGELLSVK